MPFRVGVNSFFFKPVVWNAWSWTKPVLCNTVLVIDFGMTKPVLCNTGFVRSPVVCTQALSKWDHGLQGFGWFRPSLLQAMLPAQLANVAAAALPRPPPVPTFLERIQMSVDTPVASKWWTRCCEQGELGW